MQQALQRGKFLPVKSENESSRKAIREIDKRTQQILPTLYPVKIGKNKLIVLKIRLPSESERDKVVESANLSRDELSAQRLILQLNKNKYASISAEEGEHAFYQSESSLYDNHLEPTIVPHY